MLCECLNSILALPLTDDEREIIVVDDGSEVSPMNGLMQYASHLVYVRQQNQGVSVARNTALRMARVSTYNSSMETTTSCRLPTSTVWT